MRATIELDPRRTARPRALPRVVPGPLAAATGRPSPTRAGDGSAGPPPIGRRRVDRVPPSPPPSSGAAERSGRPGHRVLSRLLARLVGGHAVVVPLLPVGGPLEGAARALGTEARARRASGPRRGRPASTALRSGRGRAESPTLGDAA